MAYGGAGADPTQLETQLALIMELGRSPSGEEEEAVGMQRGLRFPGPPMLKGGGFAIMGGYPGFMRPGNGMPVSGPMPPITGTPVWPTPPIIGEPPGPPSFSDTFDPQTPSGTFFSTPEPPSFSFVNTSLESSRDFSAPTDDPDPPSAWEEGQDVGGNILDGAPPPWWGGMDYWFNGQGWGGITDGYGGDPTSDSDPSSYDPPSASPNCHTDIDPNPVVPSFDPIPPGTIVDPKLEEWDPRNDPDPNTIYHCPGNVQGCALDIWTIEPGPPEIFVIVECPNGDGNGNPTSTPHDNPGPPPTNPDGTPNPNYDEDNPKPYFDPDGKLRVPIPPGCCTPGGTIKIKVQMFYKLSSGSLCSCCKIQLLPGQLPGTGGQVEAIEVQCEHKQEFATTLIKCCQNR